MMQRRIIDLKTLDGVVAEVDRLHTNGYQKAGQWDLSQNLSHCGQLIQQSMDGFEFSAPWLVGLARPLLKRLIFKQRVFRPGLKRPRNLLEPNPQSDESGELEKIKNLMERLKNHSGPLHASPVLGPLSLQEWYDFYTIHCSHHLGFLIPNNG
jgi:hypothetical protein